MRLSLLTVALALLPVAASPAVAADALTPEKKADIERLLDVTHSRDIGRQVSSATVEAMFASVRKAHPQIPKTTLDGIAAIVTAVIDEKMPIMMQTTVSLYDKYFDHAEVKELLAFYSTGVGQKMVRVMPALLRENFEATRQWRDSLGPEIQRRVLELLKKDGYDM